MRRKVFTALVALQPEKEYVFGLNAERFPGFQSEEGIALAPVVVRFKTGPAERIGRFSGGPIRTGG